MPAMPEKRTRPSDALQKALVLALRGESPPDEFDSGQVAQALERYECGGYLNTVWGSRSERRLPPSWRGEVERAHRKTLIDNLAALSQFHVVAEEMEKAGARYILLKGAHYLAELYDDLGARPMTDIDLLIRPGDVRGLARRLAAAGFEGDTGWNYPEYRRFEMWRPGPAACRFEFHWDLTLPGRLAAHGEDAWRVAPPVSLDGVSCLALPRDLALVNHVSHLADHYFGPTLKWVLDLRQMLRRWYPEPGSLVDLARRGGIGTALYLALRHLCMLFPGEVSPEILGSLAPRGLRRVGVGRFLTGQAVEIVDLEERGWRRSLFRLLMADDPADLARLAARVPARPALYLWYRLSGAAREPWGESLSARRPDAD